MSDHPASRENCNIAGRKLICMRWLEVGDVCAAICVADKAGPPLAMRVLVPSDVPVASHVYRRRARAARHSIGPRRTEKGFGSHGYERTNVRRAPSLFGGFGERGSTSPMAQVGDR
jgi:hypothetical protein